MVSPLMTPGLVLGIALLQYFRAIGFNATWGTLLVAHIVVCLPYVARTMIAGLSRFDFTLVEAARLLGCTYPSAIARVMIPTLAPSFLVAGLFSFLASLDNYPVSIFLTDAHTKTLPIKMLPSMARMPVFGLGESGIRAAVAHGRRFAILTIGPQLRSIVERMAATHGASGQFVALRFLGVSVLDAARDRAALEHAVLDAVHECVSQDGAEAVLLGGAPFAGVGRALTRRGTVPIYTDSKRRSSWLSPRQGWISRKLFSRRRQKKGAESQLRSLAKSMPFLPAHGANRPRDRPRVAIDWPSIRRPRRGLPRCAIGPCCPFAQLTGAFRQPLSPRFGKASFRAALSCAPPISCRLSQLADSLRRKG